MKYRQSELQVEEILGRLDWAELVGVVSTHVFARMANLTQLETDELEEVFCEDMAYTRGSTSSVKLWRP
jgi:hypothetical protein